LRPRKAPHRGNVYPTRPAFELQPRPPIEPQLGLGLGLGLGRGRGLGLGLGGVDEPRRRSTSSAGLPIALLRYHRSLLSLASRWTAAAPESRPAAARARAADGRGPADFEPVVARGDARAARSPVARRRPVAFAR